MGKEEEEWRAKGKQRRTRSLKAERACTAVTEEEIKAVRHPGHLLQVNAVTATEVKAWPANRQAWKAWNSPA